MARAPADPTGNASPVAIWSRTVAARRFGRAIVWMIVLKIVLLSLLWGLFIRPQPRIPQTPEVIARHLVPTPAPVHAPTRP